MILRQALAKKVVFAFNCGDLVIYKGIVEAVRETNVPTIMQVSPGQMDFWGLERFASLVKKEKVPVFLNFDHCRNLSIVEKAINLGFDMIHFDGSDLPWEENIELTKKAVEMAHKKGILAEGEPERDNTSPDKALEFVQRTGVDLIAIFVGNRHGMDKNKVERLNFDRLRAIKKAVKGEKLVLHGGSGVNQNDLIKAINEKLIVKINVNTLLRLAYRQALEEQLAVYSGVKVYQLMTPVVLKIKGEVKKIINSKD